MRDSCKNDTQSDRVHEETHNGLHSDEQSSPVAIVGGAVPITYKASLSNFRGRAYSIDLKASGTNGSPSCDANNQKNSILT